MPNQSQIFVRGTDGNLWLEKSDENGNWGNIPQMIQRRRQVDGSVSNLFAQVGGNRIWRPAFQPLSSSEIFVLGGDGNLWHEPGPFDGNVSKVVANRLQVDGNVYQFGALDSNTIFVLGTDGNLWLETGPWGNVSDMIQRRHLIDGFLPFEQVSSFQVIDSQTVFVLRTDSTLWYETWADPSNIIRLQVDGNVLQFWAVGSQAVFVNGNDLNLWLETGPWGNVDNTIEFRKPVDANVNDIQPIDVNTIFVMGHDGNLWLETGPFVSISQTIQTRTLFETNVICWEASLFQENSYEAYLIDGDQNLWYYPPYENRQQVDANAYACFPLFTPPSLF